MAVPQTAQIGSLNAAVAYVTDAAAAYGAVGINIVTGLTGTVVFEATIDSANWFGIFAYPMVGGVAVSSVANPTTTQYIIPIFGFAQIRVRCSAYTSGVAVVTIDAASSDLGAFGSNALMPNGGGMVDSIVYFGTATAPGAGGDILAASTPGVAGTYQVVCTVSVGKDGIEADVGNIEFMKQAALFLKLANPAPGMAQFSWRMTITAANTIGVKAIAAATAATVYCATVVMTQVA
jgi:hypothetical protein